MNDPDESASSGNLLPDRSITSDKQSEEKPKGNKGALIVDAMVADQMIAYQTDLGLIARSREESERLIDGLCQTVGVKDKPRTYWRMARKQYLNVAKKNNKTRHEVRKAIGQQLRYLRRNLKSINGLLNRDPGNSFPLVARDQKIYRVIQNVYDQQEKMYKDHTHSVENRIVNIYQPHVRSIVRGKDKANVEFGAKLSVSIQNGTRGSIH